MPKPLSEAERMTRNFLQRHRHCAANLHACDHTNNPKTYLGVTKRKRKELKGDLKFN
jgi:hypothetical protein